MMCEPLKNKLLKCDAGYKVIDKEYRHLFDKDDVKSAVEGCINGIHDFFLQDDKHYFSNLENYMEHRFGSVKKIIEKWFKDVVV